MTAHKLFVPYLSVSESERERERKREGEGERGYKTEKRDKERCIS